MKKIIQYCAIVALIAAFSAVSASAKPVTRYDAQIPFAFKIREKSYPAGTYVVRVTKISSSTGLLSIEDKKGKALETILVAFSGDITRGEPKFVFNLHEDERYLTKIVTRESGLVLPENGNHRQIVGEVPHNSSNIPSTVAGNF